MKSYLETLEDAIGKYLGSIVLQRIKEDPMTALELNLQSIEATMLFMDLRAFTQIATKTSPGKLMNELNLYLKTMSEIVIRNNGHIDSIIGDAIFAIFGISGAHHADDACRTAIECLNAIDKLNKGDRGGKLSFDLGIGINSGTVMLGNIGSEHNSLEPRSVLGMAKGRWDVKLHLA